MIEDDDYFVCPACEIVLHSEEVEEDCGRKQCPFCGAVVCKASEYQGWG